MTDTSPDRALLERIAAGDAQAFTTFFRQHRGDVYRFALHMTGSTATADDVTQEVFLTVMRDANRYDVERGTVVAWLLGIARNMVRRRMEQERQHQPLPDAQDASAWFTSVERDPLGTLTHAEQIAHIRRAVMSLPLRYREAVVLCDLQEMSYSDAAQALNCAVGTVRSRLHRGRALLAAKMREARPTRINAKISNARCLA